MPKSIVFSHKISRSQIIFQHFETQQLHFASFSFSNYSPVLHYPPRKNQLLVVKTSSFQTLFTLKSRTFISKAKDKTTAQRENLCISRCVLHHLTLRLAPFYLAFCCIQPCVLQHLALRFAAFSLAFCCKTPTNTISCVFIHYIINFYAITLHSLSSVNKPSRELNICAQVSC